MLMQGFTPSNHNSLNKVIIMGSNEYKQVKQIVDEAVSLKRAEKLEQAREVLESGL